MYVYSAICFISISLSLYKQECTYLYLIHITILLSELYDMVTILQLNTKLAKYIKTRLKQNELQVTNFNRGILDIIHLFRECCSTGKKIIIDVYLNNNCTKYMSSNKYRDNYLALSYKYTTEIINRNDIVFTEYNFIQDVLEVSIPQEFIRDIWLQMTPKTKEKVWLKALELLNDLEAELSEDVDTLSEDVNTMSNTRVYPVHLHDPHLDEL